MNGKSRLRFQASRSKALVYLGVFGALIIFMITQDLWASTRIYAGPGYFTIALQIDGTVWAWGNNQVGQLGDGTTANRLSPIQVSNLAGVVAVSGGSYHSLALKADGTVWAWGKNETGQLGDGTRTNRLLPIQVSNLAGVVAVSGGAGHSLALKADGTVWAWGYNGSGQLGDGSIVSKNTPVQVFDLAGVVAVAGGGGHSLALKADGTVWAWGRNSYGALGDGTTTDRLLPTQVSNLAGVVAVAGGGLHSLAIKADSTVWAWGMNAYGALGDGTKTNRLSPVQVLNLAGIVEVVGTGDLGSRALKADGTVWAWGVNADGALGDGSNINRETPVQVLNLSGAIAICGGGRHSLAIKADGSAWAWGDNYYGQLGDATTSDRLLPALSQFVIHHDGSAMISGGMLHSLALKPGAGGTVYSWGYNSWGQLGNGTTSESHAPGVVNNLGDVKALGNCSQGYQTVVLKSDGTVWAWGNDHWGQLGDGNYGEGVTSPVPVRAIGLSGVAAVATAARHSLALKADGTVWTWGYNEYGNLGDGTTNDRHVPGLVPGLSGIKAVIGGNWGYSLALRADGTVWTWGSKASWYPETCGPNVLSPEQIIGLTEIIAISAGNCRLALKADGTVWTWGAVYADDGTYITQCTPVQVNGLTETVAISAGLEHSLALKADGTVWAWGDNYFGELGTCPSQPSPLPFPLKVVGLNNVVAIAAGGNHSLALKADGTIWAWGDNYGGQVGDGTNRNTRCVPSQVLPDDCTFSVPTGTNVTITPKDPVTGDNPVTASFSNVTEEGTIAVNSSPGAANLPENFRILNEGENYSVYFVSTTAMYEGYVTVCIAYEDAGMWHYEGDFRLYHYWDVAQSAGKAPGIDPTFDYTQSGWEDVTISLDTLNNIICGTVTSLSPFMIGLPMEIMAPANPIPVNTKICVSVPYGHEGSAIWDFGDGPMDQGAISGDGTSWVAEHTYTSPGVYKVTLQLLSDGNTVGTAEYRYVVVYDSTAGFVTGGGWIDSPAGAYVADPALTGKANFGFVSKYQKTSPTPSGSTEFQFKAGDLNFFSNSYEWLVVSGAKAKFKGTGTINGTGTYKFMLTGIDAEINKADVFTVDRFRIKIWTEDAEGHETVVYDNALGDDSDQATTAIGGGSIMIHN